MAHPSANGQPTGQPPSNTISFPGVPKRFDLEGAAQFLRNSPLYVARHAKWIEKNYTRAFIRAGYRFDGDKLLIRDKAKPGPGGRVGRPPTYSTVFAYTGDQIAKTGDKGGLAPTKPAPAAPAGGEQPTRDVAVTTNDAGVSGGLDAPMISTAGLDGLNPNVGRYINPALSNGGARLLPLSGAHDMAGLQYDASIQDLAAALAKAPRDTAQQKKDVGSWYGQVLDSLRTAAGRDTAATQAGVDSVKDATAAIVSSLGGAANQGSALVGATGADAAATLAALGTTQDQYNADIAPLLQAEKAGALERVAARGSSTIADLAMKLAQAKGQKGQAEAANRLQLQQANNAVLDNRNKMLIEILGANNQLGQQRFSNQYGIETSKLGAAVSGAQIIGSLAKAATGGRSGSSRTYTYAKAPQSVKEDWLAQLDFKAQQFKDDPAKAFVALRNLTNGYGWSIKNPAVMAGIQQVASKYGLKF